MNTLVVDHTVWTEKGAPHAIEKLFRNGWQVYVWTNHPRTKYYRRLTELQKDKAAWALVREFYCYEGPEIADHASRKLTLLERHFGKLLDKREILTILEPQEETAAILSAYSPYVCVINNYAWLNFIALSQRKLKEFIGVRNPAVAVVPESSLSDLLRVSYMI